MSKLFYNFWLNIEPFRSKWIIPILVLTFLVLIFCFFGHTDDMKCNWEDRDRWECAPVP